MVLLITKTKNFKANNFLQIHFPLKISKLIEKINIQFIKFKSKENSNINIGKYILNINSRTLTMNSSIINLTEKEVNLILHLHGSTEPVNVKTLQQEVWGYRNSLESHTVETHIYRLRKKISEKFVDEEFILNNKQGYYL